VSSLYSLKVLGDDNNGFSSWLIGALNWVLANGPDVNIKVINLSLGINAKPGPEGSDTDREFQGLKNVICGLTEALSDSGVVVVVAAGNEGTDLSDRLPGSCPTVLTVTALDSDGETPAPFSNWLPGNSASS